MRKNFVLDTNVLISNPDAFDDFEDNNVYVTQEVLAELDRLKSRKDDPSLAYHARKANERLRELSLRGDLRTGVQLDTGGRLFVLSDPLAEELRPDAGVEEQTAFLLRRIISLMAEQSYKDNRIVERAQRLKADSDLETILVTKDTGAAIKAESSNPRIEAQDYEAEQAKIDLNDFFERMFEFSVPKEIISRLHRSEELQIDVIEKASGVELGLDLNAYFCLKDSEGSSSSVLAFKNGSKVVRIYEPRAGLQGGIRARNSEQRFLIDVLLREDITEVACIGKAGTGKTFLALAAALEQVLEDSVFPGRYNKIIVYRPQTSWGKEMGFLPGNVEEKMAPYFKPILTALGRIGQDLDDFGAIMTGQTPFDFRTINFESGETIYNSFVIVDEAQNFTRREIAFIGTRVGIGSKLVLTGDPFQVGHPYLDTKTSGIATAVDRLRNKTPLFAYVVLTQGERSEIAEDFSNLF
ncbi:hypothetical protein COV17_03770 [Candidatus Woesearchaeota archaeon CG10_big_fil_rev_8_21_14_0_10_36_11]|nr:MAG: hypothetical protein COV17_03770 [Candidatus Woesearchaeota archaeon CG10_big_fil_rev_8_21_14_0_10_36_11]